MGDEEEPQCKVEYLDIAEGGEPEETNWIRRAGKCRVTYPNGHIFEGKRNVCCNLHYFPYISLLIGTFDAERIKQGFGTYIWMGPGSEEDETPVEKARYEGNYKDGLKHGMGKMVFPNGNIYEGEWFENKVRVYVLSTGTNMDNSVRFTDARGRHLHLQEGQRHIQRRIPGRQKARPRHL